MGKYLNIVFNVPLNQEFTYENIEEKENGLGKRVKANFGNKELIGFVVKDLDKLPTNFDPQIKIKKYKDT